MWSIAMNRLQAWSRVKKECTSNLANWDLCHLHECIYGRRPWTVLMHSKLQDRRW